MVSGSQATVRTCNDYSGSNVRRFSSRCGRHETLSLLTVITKKIWVHYWTCTSAWNLQWATCVSEFNGAIKRKCRNWHLYSAVLVTFIYLYIYLYISIHINIISFPFLYGFLKTKYLNKIGKKISREGGVVFDNGNINWCMLGRTFLCRTIFVSNHAFCCRSGII